MKFSLAAAVALAATANAHAIMQKVSIDGSVKAQLEGLRAPSENNPTYSVTDQNIICDSDGTKSSTVLSINPGSRVGFYWGHVIGGAQFANDPDNPIASSHKGPIQVYFAKVSSAASTSKTGLSWFKVASEGLNGGKWGVDTMIQGGGWWYFTVPSCLAAGEYLARIELIALHNGYDNLGAQFYMSCAQFKVGGSGTYTPSSTVSFPGAYSQSDPGIAINIYGAGGVPNNNNRPYTAPGPAVITCPAGGNPQPQPTTTRPPTQQTTTATRPPTQTTAPSGGSGGCSAAKYAQCGGTGFSGCTTCASGSTCKVLNPYYSQCQ